MHWHQGEQLGGLEPSGSEPRAAFVGPTVVGGVCGQAVMPSVSPESRASLAPAAR